MPDAGGMGHLCIHTHPTNNTHPHSPTEAWTRRAVMDPGIALELRMLHEKVLGLEAEARKAREEAQAAQFSSQR